jgi:acetolactate synthase-1/2/3 large subunit
LPLFGKGPLQESACTGINILGMFEHCTRYNSLVSHRDQLETKLAAALIRACQAPYGPVHLSVPVDVMRGPVEYGVPTYDLLPLLLKKPSLVDEIAIEALYAKIKSAHRIVLLIGGNCGDAIGPILEFAESARALFITTPDGVGLVSPNHRLYRGVYRSDTCLLNQIA